MTKRDPGDGAATAAPSRVSGRRRRPVDVSTLSREEQRERAREAALRLLGSRERTVAELREKLKAKNFDRFVIEEVLDRFAEAGLLDDVRYAERYASEAAGTRAFASRRIRTDLLRRGVDRELAIAASTRDPDDEEAQARALALSRVARMERLEPEARARRILGLLARRGYDADVCRRVATEVANFEDAER